MHTRFIRRHLNRIEQHAIVGVYYNMVRLD